jgi:hypothetical protein
MTELDIAKDKPKQIALVYRKMRISEQGSDLEYWLSQPPAARLAAVEEIIREYHGWEPGEEPRMERAVTIIKRWSRSSSADASSQDES